MKQKLLITTLLLTLFCTGAWATKTYATFGDPAKEGSWDSSTNTYSWTQSYSNLMPIFTFSNGELANYTELHLTTSNYNDGQPYRVCFMNGSNAVATISFYSAGDKTLVFSTKDETKNIDLSTITSIQFGGASASGSITVDPTSVYLVKPMNVAFGDDGKFSVDLTDLDYDSNLTYNPQTGEMTSNGQGTFSISFNNEDFTEVTNMTLTYTGDGIVQFFTITDAVNGTLNTWYSSKYNCTPDATIRAKAGSVTKYAWNCNVAGTMTIKSIVLTANVVSATNAHETNIASLPYYKWSGSTWNTATPSINLNTATDTYYGSGSSDQKEYVDVSAYDELRIYSADNNVPRCFFMQNTTLDGTGTGATINATKNGDYYYVDLNSVKTEYSVAYLIGIKSAGWNQKYTVSSIVLYSSDADGDYSISGSGIMTSSVTAALADESATYYNASGLTGAATLNPANPNALIVAPAGLVTRDDNKNIVVDGTCANLVLTDGYPFKNFAEFTATSATYTRSLATGKYGTICLPFAPGTGNYKFMTLASADGGVLSFAEEASPKADTPYLYRVADGGTESAAITASSATVPATDLAAGTTAADYTMKGTYETTEFGSTDGIYFIKNNTFYHFAAEGSKLTVKPFRAYFQAASAGAKELTIEELGEETGVESISSTVRSEELGVRSDVYNLSGVKVGSDYKGIVIVNGRKEIRK